MLAGQDYGHFSWVDFCAADRASELSSYFTALWILISLFVPKLQTATL